MNIVAFAASNSSKSINKQLATYAANLLNDHASHSIEILDLNDYELPLFSVDKEAELGQPEAAQQFIEKIETADAIIISFAEHNGSYTAAYKNLFDWCSRIKQKVYADKTALLLATSPGAGGAQTVLKAATNSMPFFGADVVGSFSLPAFYDNFDQENNIISNTVLADELKNQLQRLIK